MKAKPYVGDPKFKAELDAIAEAHSQPKPLTPEERAKLKEVVTRPFAPMHEHRDSCWGPVESRFVNTIATRDKKRVTVEKEIKVQRCQFSGTVREAR